MTDARRFVVSQLDWAPFSSCDPYFRRTPRAARVATFTSFDKAEIDRQIREAAFRRRANPFRYGGEALFYQSSLDAPRLHDWLMDAGIDPPAAPSGHSAWVEWWDAAAHTWSAEQRAHAWAAFDKVRFFEVTELAERPAYVVVELKWQETGDERVLEADYEGGVTVRAFRSRTAAEAECARLNLERQSREQHAGYSSFTRRTRGDGSDGMSRTIAETVFFEVVEVGLAEAL